MKQLIRRLSRVADSSSTHYSLLRSRSQRNSSNRSNCRGVPQGHVPVFVGEEMERFVVSAEFLNHPIFVELLKKSAQEYGYEQKGVLRIPCRVLVFRQVLDLLRFGDHHHVHVQDLEEINRELVDEFV